MMGPMSSDGCLDRIVALGVEKRGRSLKSFQRVLTSHWKILEKKEGLLHSLAEEEILLN